jgi:hypothetical protein
MGIKGKRLTTVLLSEACAGLTGALKRLFNQRLPAANTIQGVKREAYSTMTGNSMWVG